MGERQCPICGKQLDEYIMEYILDSGDEEIEYCGSWECGYQCQVMLDFMEEHNGSGR
jgi:hypothetical protein